MEVGIIIFHHSYLINNWKEIIIEQLSILKSSELYDNSEQIHFCCYSEIKENIIEFFDLINDFDTLKKCTIVIEPYNDNERLTLLYMQSLCKNMEEKYVLYFHTKGVTSSFRYGESGEKNIKSWRNIMEYYLIERWKICIEKIENHDVVSLFYGDWHHSVTGEIMNYFSGNFWWSKVTHINRTPDMRQRDNWLGCETLITSIPHIWFNFKFIPPNLSMYDIYFDPIEYR